MITQEERKYLIESMVSLLNQYDYKYTEDALNKIIDKWVEQKSDLITAFKKHPNYVEGQFMIAFDKDYERLVSDKGARDFSEWLGDNALRRTDLTPKEILDRRAGCQWLPNDLWEFLLRLQTLSGVYLSEGDVVFLSEVIPEVRVHVGEKTSRVVNKILTYLNYNKVSGYNREFTKYADSLSPLVVKRHTVLSINPLDYLTMSFGNSWSSCHTIDTKNKRDMPNSYHGAYSSGTISYMLDKASMVFYVVDGNYDGNEFWGVPKIHRQMFHYGEEKLVQGRLYPQSNDNGNSYYVEYRNIVQSIISTIFDFPNLWTFKTGRINASKYINSLGTHYRDYAAYDRCSVSRIRGSVNENKFEVGALPICIRCGKEHSDCERIDHCIVMRCSHCGAIISEEDAIEVDGHVYCRGCVNWCDRCQRYHREENTYINDEYIYVCRSCRDEHYVVCEECGRYVRKDRTYEKDGKKICRRCKESMERRTKTDNNFSWLLNHYAKIVYDQERDNEYFTYDTRSGRWRF